MQYNPFDQRGVIKNIKNLSLHYTLVIKPNGRLPKTGILFCQYLNKISVKDLNILDIGTGETALLAIHLVKLGAKNVVAIDTDSSVVGWARKNVKINNLMKRVVVKEIALQKYKPDFKFDLIISNPPQMPVRKSRSIHDDGGRDGKFFIRQIIKFAASSLNQRGILIFSSFDFLGVNRNYNGKPSIFNLLTKHLFTPQTIGQYVRIINPLSYTAKNFQWIKLQYPRYKFIKNKKGLYQHKIFIVSAKKK